MVEGPGADVGRDVGAEIVQHHGDAHVGGVQGPRVTEEGARARARQADPDWQADYRATRPKVERKLAHLMRRKHGGRRAPVRGTPKVDADFRLLAAAANLARLGALGVRFTPTTGWAIGG